MLQLDWNTKSDKFSSLFSIGLMGATIIFPFFVVGLLMGLYKKLGTKPYRERIGAIYEEIKVDSRPPLLYNFFFVFRRFLFALTVVFLIDYPFF